MRNELDGDVTKSYRMNTHFIIPSGNGGSRPGVWGEVKLGRQKCLHLFKYQRSATIVVCHTKVAIFVGQNVAFFVGRTMLLFRE